MAEELERAEQPLDVGLAPSGRMTAFPASGRLRFGADDALELSEAEHDRLAEFLAQEIQRSEQETRPFQDELALWRAFVDPRPKAKDFPWVNASNVFVPIPRLVLDTTKSTIKQAVNKQTRAFTADVIDSEALGMEPGKGGEIQEALVTFAEKLAKPEYLDLSLLVDEGSEEMLVAGFVPFKLTVHKDEREVWTRNRVKKTVIYKRGPKIEATPVGTFVWPAGVWRSVHEMAWAGNWVYHTDAEMRRRAQAPWSYRHTEEVIEGGATTEKAPAYALEEKTLRQDIHAPGHKTYEIALIWAPYEDGEMYDLLVTINVANRKIHRVIYNPIGDGLKPFEIESASPRASSWQGRGIIEPIVQPVRGINAAVNQTFDSQTLANAPSVLYPEDSPAGEVLSGGFFPGLPIPYKERPDEIAILKFPDPSATSFQLVSFFLNVIERLTRTGPSATGDVGASKRVPASLGLAIGQAGRELTDELLDRLRVTIGRLWSRSIMLYAEEDPDLFVKLLGPEKGELLLEAVRSIIGLRTTVFDTMHLTLTASSASRSVEMERQNAMATLQLTMGWEREVIQLMTLYFQALQQPEPIASTASGVLLDILKASQLQVRRLVELSNQPDAQNIVPDIAARLEEVRAMMNPSSPGGASVPPAGASPTSSPGGGEPGGTFDLSQLVPPQ